MYEGNERNEDEEYSVQTARNGSKDRERERERELVLEKESTMRISTKR